MAAVNGASKGAVARGVFALARGRRARRAAVIALSLAILAAGLVLWDGLPAFLPLIAFAGAIAAAFAVYWETTPRAGWAWAWSARASSPSRSPLCWRRPPRAWRAWSDSSGL